MSDFLATLGLADDGLDSGLRAAIEKEKRYAREVKRINRSLGDDAAREYRRILEKYDEVGKGQKRFASGALRAGKVLGPRRVLYLEHLVYI